MKKRFEAIDRLAPLRQVILEYGLSAQKSLGQNFLLDMNVTDKIVREAELRCQCNWSELTAIEIGPGPGGLTRSLLRSGLKQVCAIEFDKRAVHALEPLVDAAHGDLDIVHNDAMQCDLSVFVDSPRIIVANLPYNIATPLLVNWLRQIRNDYTVYHSMSLMFQKEVAERICAQVGQKAYGRLSVLAQWLCDVEIMYHLPASAFTPAPKVDSAVVHFTPKILSGDAPLFEVVERVSAAAFGQRRKMIRSSLRDYADCFDSLGLEPTKRAENLSVEAFISIASCVD